MKKQKEVQKVTRKENLKLIVFELIQKGFRPSQICKLLNIKETALQYHLSTLKRLGFIKKIGYGVWEILKEFDQKELQKTTRVAHNNWGSKFEVLKEGQVRGHAFQFKLQVPDRLRNWEKRKEILSTRDIKFEPLNHLFGGGQSLEIKGRKIHLTNNSVIIYEKESYIADLAKDAKSMAICHFFNLVRKLEKQLKADFSIHGQYKFRVTRQHYALVKNALAKQYDEKGNKLEVYSGNGLWFIIDNSYNLHEAETVHPRDADIDNEKVQDFFNSLKVRPITTQEIHSNFKELREMMKTSSENQIMLGQVLQQMESNLVKITKKMGGSQNV
ncbi:MAG: helix-turn-helix domain-containing protein [Candidatus Woesearchaeota archaeon]